MVLGMVTFPLVSNLVPPHPETSFTFFQAMASAGIIPGMLTCALSGAVGGFGLYLLTRCARHTPDRQSSFFAIAQITFPQAAVFFDAAVAIKCFGVSIRYVSINNSPRDISC